MAGDRDTPEKPASKPDFVTDEDMVRALARQLDEWESDPAVTRVIARNAQAEALTASIR